MTNFEDDVHKMIEKHEEIPGKIDISLAKYLWESSVFASGRKDTIPKFLRKVHVFQNFTDNELRIFSQFLHRRNFNPGEVVFKQGQEGVGFYLIYEGHLDVVMDGVEGNHETSTANYILTLDQGDYFGELALLQDNSPRQASVLAKERSVLLGFFKPDVEELINYHPIIAAKLLQSISTIVANRLYTVTLEVRKLKSKLNNMNENIKE